jgi:serine phosphatase RsbU (regulator of sigma subunit)
VNTLAVSFARAGHPNPILLTRKGEAQSLEADGGLLGIFPDDTYANGHTLIRPGDRLFLFTDGVDVAFTESPQHADWKQELLKRQHMPTTELLEDLERHLNITNGGAMPKDDLTIVVAEAS